MKILNITFKNINSLEGENRIDFELPPLADAGVFAITGPNGSGKTTILDAISLGLYGETYRLNRPSAEVMTRNTSESFATVEFAIGAAQYRSSWRIIRTDGELIGPEMELLQLNGQDLDQQSISDLTGMDFQRFSRSIVLAQGEFAAFLNALDSERLDILEKIINTDIYTAFQKEIEDKAASANLEMDKLQTQFAAIHVLDNEQLQAKEQDLADFKEQAADFNDASQELQQQLNGWENLTRLKQNIADLAAQSQVAEKQLVEQQGTLEKINAAQAVLVYKDDIAELDNKLQEAQNSKQSLQTYRSELNQIKRQLAAMGVDTQQIQAEDAGTIAEKLQSFKQLKNQKTQLELDQQSETSLLQALQQQLDNKQSILHNTANWLLENAAYQVLLKHVPELDKLTKLQQELVALDEKQSAFSKWKKSTNTALKKNQAEIEKLTGRDKSLIRQLQEYENDLEAQARGNTLEEINALHIEQLERIQNFKNLYDLASQHKKLDKMQSGWFGLGASVIPDPDELRKVLQSINETLVDEEKIKQKLDKQATYYTLLKTMDQYRQYLDDGEPCPLCGAESHPFSEHSPDIEDPHEALTAQQAKLKKLQSEAAKLVKQINSAEIKLQQDGDTQQHILQIRSQWMTLCTRLNQVSDDLDISNIRLMRKRLKAEQAELKDIATLIRKYQRGQAKIDQFRQRISGNKTTLEQLKNANQQLDTEWKNRPQELIDLETAYENCRQQEQKLAESIRVQLTVLGEEQPTPETQQALLEKLKQRREDYKIYSARQASLQEEIQAIEVKISACHEKNDALKQQLTLCENAMQQQESSGLQLALIEKQKIITEKEQLTLQMEQNAAALKQEIENKLAASDFKSVAAVKAVMALINRQASVEQQISALETKLEKQAIDTVKYQAQLEAEQALAVTEQSAEELIARRHEIDEKTAIAKQEIVHLEKILQQQSSLHDKARQLKAKITEQQQICDKNTAELEQITTGNGNVFRRRVQKKMADQLLQISNKILEKINGRYYVHQVACDHGLALEIEDTRQHGRRQPNTLSGGESFAVSLALALGLSELANNGRAVDSLFIDEGFGTLDPNTLASVVNTLEDLKTHGKTIGVISHVEAVRKRFKIQIETLKKANGLSELKIQKTGIKKFKLLKK